MGVTAYIASDGDWRWAAAGAVGGGLLGGVMFDQDIKRFNVGTRDFNFKIKLTLHEFAGGYRQFFYKLYRVPLREFFKTYEANGPEDITSDVLKQINDNHPDLVNKKKTERMKPTSAWVGTEGNGTRGGLHSEYNKNNQNLDDFEYGNPGYRGRGIRPQAMKYYVDVPNTPLSNGRGIGPATYRVRITIYFQKIHRP